MEQHKRKITNNKIAVVSRKYVADVDVILSRRYTLVIKNKGHNTTIPVNSLSQAEEYLGIYSDSPDVDYCLYILARPTMVDYFGMKVSVKSQKKDFVISCSFKSIDEFSKIGFSINTMSAAEYKDSIIGIAKQVFNKDFSGTNGHFDTNDIEQVHRFSEWLRLTNWFSLPTHANNRVFRPILYLSKAKYIELFEQSLLDDSVGKLIK